MGTETKIEWTDHTWNPWQGCTKVSPGCLHCYMERQKKAYGQDPFTVVRSAPGTFAAPVLKTRSGAWRWPDDSRVFTCSWSDFFHPAADAWRSEAWEIIADRPGLRFQILTKRPERLRECLPLDWRQGWPNVALGVTIESQEQMPRAFQLLQVPALSNYRRFLSLEPLLGPVRIPTRILMRVDQVIVGGESGPNARPCHPDWVRSIRDQCNASLVPFFFKQWGEYCAPAQMPEETFQGWECEHGAEDWDRTDPRGWRVGKKAAGRLLDGRTWEEVPG